MGHSKPLAIDLFAGLFGWGDGLIAEGYEILGFDIIDMFAELRVERRSEFNLVIQDVLTLHGSQFKDAALIVASPPCQEFSYMAMPWSLAKEKQRAIEADPRERKRLTALFDACFRMGICDFTYPKKGAWMNREINAALKAWGAWLASRRTAQGVVSRPPVVRERGSLSQTPTLRVAASPSQAIDRARSAKARRTLRRGL